MKDFYSDSSSDFSDNTSDVYQDFNDYDEEFLNSSSNNITENFTIRDKKKSF